MKKKFIPIMGMAMCLGLAGCGDELQSSIPSTPSSSDVVTPSSAPAASSSQAPQSSAPEASSSEMIVKKEFKIFLAGDSTVKTYNENTFIAGWGQYFNQFLDTEYVTVVNAAEGGRSSRSFINEGRLYESSATEKFKVTSIESQISEGDYLFIQFGHNDDDTKKASSYSTMYDRMVPLGTPDANGIYPTTEGTKVANTHLPDEYIANTKSSDQSKALETTAKYGDTYYSYDCGGTYKWFLKQYVDFAQSKGAIPVLVTPVARVKFDADGTLKGGPGLHGENFAYVEAVRQLADELNVALIDLFDDTKTILETATPDYANYLMALKPNDLPGQWPQTYDLTYGNTSYGYTGIEGTHYNKYGAYLTAAMLCDDLFEISSLPLKHYVKDNGYFIAPSNNITKSVISNLNSLVKNVSVTDPNAPAQDVAAVISAIDALDSLTITMDSIESVEAAIKECLLKYYGINVDDRAQVTNYGSIAAKEKAISDFILANRKDPIAVYELNANDLTAATVNESVNLTTTDACFALKATSAKAMEIASKSASVTIGLDSEPTKFTQSISLKGTGNADYRSIHFNVTGACTITVVCQSGNASETRVLRLVNASTGADQTVSAEGSACVGTYEVTEAGSYYLTSASSGIHVFMVRIEYFE